MNLLKLLLLIFLLFLLHLSPLLAQRVRDLEYIVESDRLNIMYMLDPIPEIHKLGWNYRMEVKVEGKVLGNLKPLAATGDLTGISPNEFQKQILWEVQGDKESLTDGLKVTVNVMDMGGPYYAWKSVLVPGAGLKFVTGRNQIGLLRTFSVYSLLATSICTRLISRGIYRSYLRSDEEFFVSDYYTGADFFHKVSILTCATGLGIWVWDIINTAQKGKKNIKYLNRPLKVNPTASPTGYWGIELRWRLHI